MIAGDVPSKKAYVCAKMTPINTAPSMSTAILASNRAAKLDPGKRKNSHSSALDRTDIAILGLLQNNARLSVKEIAAEVGLAPSSTHERIRRRWDAGVLGSPYRDVDHL